MIEIIQLLINGILLGSILALGAVGATMIFGVLRFAHFAHGDFMAIGAYFALTVVTVFNLPVLAALPVAMLLTGGLAILIDQVVYRRIRRVQPVILLIASFATALVLRSFIQMVWGGSNQVYEAGIQLPLRFGPLTVKPDHLLIFAAAAGLVLIVHLFLSRTRMGKAMRAMSDNMDLALVTGIPANRVIMWTWGIGGALAAAAGVFLGMDTRLHPVMGWTLLLPIFAATILGGIGRPYGAILGGLVIGCAMELSTLVIPGAYKPAVAFAIMVATLVFRPQGIIKGNA
ncbi:MULTISPECIES: branched-chain amino acid ABC transporter permease [Spiribacter]|jgi:branched-chain amino acid transport system permease protein/neutral amino acid transport system permease protein|uniref:Branched-chain amino acid ABC transporter permease n=2 Tax=Spiribacter TaxID=1335745 RepID=A0A557RKE0_9GAMM|nr:MULTISPECIES: branched-chain amino acid ABC transporter permease [Spiribacter]PZA01173.1 branched-chain amino acid ABC transporter permease [Gammaproteobacteria bacterium 2W06]AUB77899.1 amino acid ABC transporter permease [Spiribacter roseus]KAF0279858.1 amino acid ABC transporter permease [Spiribacter roseus]KAF0281688.1 amino acid ABC transporter permease [Spiribacter roseus]KAF0283517.1 amino acid ABC transporter permease [Spiribacter roseus]